MKERDRQTDRDTERERDTHTQRETETDRQRERVPSGCLTTFIVHVQLLSIKQLPKN